MDAQPIDPCLITVETVDVEFYIAFFRGDLGTESRAFNSEMFRIRHAQFEQVRAWAAERAGNQALFAVGLFVHSAQGAIVYWLHGMGPSDTPTTEFEGVIQAAMRSSGDARP